jgi:riboflavin kinase/FMN adenylyltransferase
MKELRSWSEFPAKLRGGVLCVGNFDGVHIGHAAMLSTGREEARRRGVPFTIMTFQPHPATVLKPQVVRRPLITLEQRKELLAEFEPDVLIMLEPTRELLAILPEDFLCNIVRGAGAAGGEGGEGIGAVLMVEGPTFTFGRKARGDVRMLEALGPSLGFETIVVPTQERSLSDMTVINVSSTRIRWLIENGRVADAARALGRPHTLRGVVVEGAKRGRAIGFPTANIRTEQFLPGPGIYAGEAAVEGKKYSAAISVGTNPTFGENATTVEAYLLDFSSDLYGKTIDLAFHRWVREMLTFSGVEPLVAQITRDVDVTRKLMAGQRS